MQGVVDDALYLITVTEETRGQMYLRKRAQIPAEAYLPQLRTN